MNRGQARGEAFETLSDGKKIKMDREKLKLMEGKQAARPSKLYLIKEE